MYVLSEEEGLVLRAVEAFNDTEGVRKTTHNTDVIQWLSSCYVRNPASEQLVSRKKNTNCFHKDGG